MALARQTPQSLHVGRRNPALKRLQAETVLV